MDVYESLSHTKWECKYHVVFIPKYRRKKSRLRNFAQGDKWNFCLIRRTLCAANQEIV